MDERVKKYLLEKNPDLLVNDGRSQPQASQFDNFQNDFSDAKRAEAVAAADKKQSGLGWAQLAAGIGDAFAGRSSSQTAQNFDRIRKDIKEDTIGEFDKRKDGAIKDFSTKKAMEGSDPNSAASIAFRKSIEANFPNVAKQYGEMWGNVTADDQERLFKPLQLKESIEARKEQARILASDRAENRAQRDSDKQARLDEKMQGLQTPYGLANTIDDAKQLKEAHESKKNFDSKIQEMIDLRKKYGGEAMNREAVARGQQLSKDLLLEYKNMAKLGVLSKSDEDIINKILPEDPLAFHFAEAATGQDSILSNLQKFKGDSDRDFQTRVGTRTRQGLADMKNQSAGTPQKTIVKTQTNAKTGEKRIVYSDGTTEVVSNVAGGQ
ncbi:hypothetical protein [Bdellovibrio sp. HCB288]|uniref:hypothetical protein n=1 Tax=Bdellovibrio sp. HCB288 TaxID=3394355 RepID=UPI0039B3C358